MSVSNLSTAICCLFVALPLAVVATAFAGSSANAITLDMVTVGDAGNAADTTGFGAVAYEYRIGRHEVTIDQYTAFLNSVATASSNSIAAGLWKPWMQSELSVAGIRREGEGTIENPYVYSALGSGSRPVAYVNWFDAARFANWMHNGALSMASIESGAYDLYGATSGTFVRNPSASFWIPSEDEWYKAAYYKGGEINSGYWGYPMRSDAVPGNTVGNAANQANIRIGMYFALYPSDNFGVGTNNFDPTKNYLTDVGAFSGSEGPYGTFDQGGNLWEWNDAIIIDPTLGLRRGIRGGDFGSRSDDIASSFRNDASPNDEGLTGFRLASPVAVPEPSAWAMAACGLAFTAWETWRRKAVA